MKGQNKNNYGKQKKHQGAGLGKTEKTIRDRVWKYIVIRLAFHTFSKLSLNTQTSSFLNYDSILKVSQL